jgi:hypothetical protein
VNTSTAALGVFLAAGLAGCGDAPQPVAVETPQRRSEFISIEQPLLSYALERQDGSVVRRVSERASFRSGDRFRLVVEPQVPLHVYLFARGQDDATYRVLQSRDERRQPLATGKATGVPADGEGWLRFDTRPGTDTLVLVASTARVAALDAAAETIRRDAFEATLGTIERELKPAEFHRTEDPEWIRLSAENEGKPLAVVLRLPLVHK